MLIEGKASKEYNCDVMVIVFTFSDRSSTSAGETSIFSDCEDFLHEMEKIGIAPESFMTLDDSTSYKAKDQWPDGGYTVTSKLMLKAKVDLSLLEMILEVIRSRKYVIDYDVRYDISDERAINDELISDAFADARRKADMIVLATGDRKLLVLFVRKWTGNMATGKNLISILTADSMLLMVLFCIKGVKVISNA